jgi:signal transduction histidine kinase
MSHQAGQKNIQIDYTPLPRELIVKIDPLRVQQVLINLLQNAIKFTPEGKKITVYTQLSIEQRTSDKYKLQVLVKDEGIGMSKDDQKRLFKPFFKSSSAENRAMNTGGHGLGLSICKLLAEKLEGSLKVSSEEGKGTNIVFTLRSPVEEVLQYNKQTDPRTLLKKRANFQKKKNKIKARDITEPVLDRISENSDDALCESSEDDANNSWLNPQTTPSS